MSGSLIKNIREDDQDRKSLTRLIMVSLVLHAFVLIAVLLAPSKAGKVDEVQVTRVRIIEAPFEGTPLKGPDKDAMLKLPGGKKTEDPVVKPKAPKKIPDKITEPQRKTIPQTTKQKPVKKQVPKRKKTDTGDSLASAIEGIEKSVKIKGSSKDGKEDGDPYSAPIDPCKAYKRRQARYVSVRGSVPEAKGKRAIISVTIGSSGSASVRLSQSSGISRADRVAIGRVRKNYPAPPAGCAPVVLRVKASF